MESVQTTQSIEITREEGPVSLSFPALLRNPGIFDRFAHLHDSQERPTKVPASIKKHGRDDREGKRWIRRKENAKFVGNPHIVLASRSDYSVPQTYVRRTFPEPLPTYLPRTAKVPSTTPPSFDPISANAGRFSTSLKGMRRELRKSGGGTESLVKDVEDEIISWLETGGIILNPENNGNTIEFPGRPVGHTDVIHEVSRSPLQLVWAITDNAFTRYVVHCCARYHEIVSFSKEHSGQRLTYLLRPNVTRPDFAARAALDTPPVTDMDYSSHGVDTESDFVSEPEPKSDAGDSDAEFQVPRTNILSSINEDSVPSSPQTSISAASRNLSDDAWSIVGGSDMEGDDSGNELGLSIESLSMEDPDCTPRRPIAKPRVRQSALRARVWDSHQGRSASSPSRSPARRTPRRTRPRIEPPISRAQPRSFHDYLYA